MTERDRLIEKMVKMAIAITGKNSDKWTWDAEMAIWDLCSDWNSEHYDGMYDEAEIFMSDYQTEDSEYVNGFMIEDDYFIREE
jgi:hypothetical protein